MPFGPEKEGLKEELKEVALNYDGVLSGLRKRGVMGCAGFNSSLITGRTGVLLGSIRQGRKEHIVRVTAWGSHPL